MPDDDYGVFRFKAYVEIDTARVTNGPHSDGPGTGLRKTKVTWSVNGGSGCGGGGTALSTFSAGNGGFFISSLYPGEDCGMYAWVLAPGTGSFENPNDPLTQ